VYFYPALSFASSVCLIGGDIHVAGRETAKNE